MLQEPPSEGTRFLIIDTNVLLDHLEVLKKFVEHVEGRGLPVILVVPGIVIQELDGSVSPYALRHVLTSMCW
jgi:predicted ribonuclease YlaK